MHFCRPAGSQSLDLTLSTAFTASLSSNLTLTEANVNAVDVFQPMGCSLVPTDICLVGLDGDLVDEFNTPLQDPSDTLAHPVDFDDAPCDTADPHDWHDNDIDDVHAPVAAGAMVTCTGQ